MGNFYNGGLWGHFSCLVGSSWNFVPGYIKNVDTHHESFSSKKQVIKKLSPNSLWQTYMKLTVVEWSIIIQSNLDISKLIGLFLQIEITRSANRFVLRVIWTCKKVPNAKLWPEKAIKMYFLFRYSTDNVFVVILFVHRTYIDGIFIAYCWYVNGIILSYRISYYYFNN